jgi:hypothetical protein
LGSEDETATLDQLAHVPTTALVLDDEQIYHRRRSERSLLSYALQRVSLQRRRVSLGVFHCFLHTLPLQQPSYVVIAVPGLCNHNVCWSHDKKQRLSFDMTQLRPKEHVRRAGRGGREFQRERGNAEWKWKAGKEGSTCKSMADKLLLPRRDRASTLST